MRRCRHRHRRQPAHGAVRNLFLGEGDGAGEGHQLLHIAHLVVKRQFQAPEDPGDHAGALVLVAVEGPAMSRFEALGLRFGDVVQHGTPAQPEVIALLSHIVQHLQRVVEVVLVADAVFLLGALQFHELGEELLEQSTLQEQYESEAGGRGDDLVRRYGCVPR